MHSPDIWSQFSPGTLTDKDINTLAGAGHLIVENFESNNVQQACYELRASDVFYEIDSPRENPEVIVSQDKGYLLKPHSYVTAITLEKISLTNQVMGRILTKGRLFSIGILPVNTYADPGFTGRLGITLCNVSHRYIVIRPKEPIAKIEFSLLPKPVERPYSGQHGYGTESWPRRSQLYASEGELKAHGVDESSTEAIKGSYGPVIAHLVEKVNYYETKVWLQIATLIIVLVIIFSLYDKLSWAVAIGIAIVANVDSLVKTPPGPLGGV